MRFALGRRAAFQAVCVGLSGLIFAPLARAGTNFDLQQAPGGLALTASGNNYRSTFGTVDALGINSGSAGLTAIAQTTGTLYFTPYQIFIHNNGIPANRHGYVTAYVSTNFAHPAAIVIFSCPSNATCNAANAFSAMSTSATAETVVVPTPGLLRGQTATAGIAIWLPDNDGPTAFTGTDSVIVSLRLIEFENAAVVETLQWQFNLAPFGVTIQNAIRLTLSSSVGGATIVATGGTPDFTLNFGNVNGLGIGPAAGLTTTAGTGGYFYSTPYDLNAAFTDFTSNTATINVYVITDFAHPALLQLNDATSTSGPFTAISKNRLAQTLLTNTAADRSRTTRVLGLFVANTSGAASFRGADAATLTYTMTVP